MMLWNTPDIWWSQMPVLKETTSESSAYLTEALGPHKSHLSRYTNELSAMGDTAYQSVSNPVLTVWSFWCYALQTLF